MKLIISTIVFFLIVVAAFPQGKYFTKTGKATFYSKAPLEDIDAKNNNAVSVFDKTTGQVEVVMLMKAFEFRKALMQEHFNENYIESDKFPKSVFKGLIGDLSKVDFTKNGKYQASVSGKLSLHGETNDVAAPVTFTINNGMINAISEFKIVLEDYKVSIPAIVKDKISKEVRVVIEINYEPLIH